MTTEAPTKRAKVKPATKRAKVKPATKRAKVKPATKRAKVKAASPKPSPRATYHHGDLKHALVEVTLQLITEDGVEGFTLREAARRLGVSHRATYRHFADKTALLAAVAEQGFGSLVAVMEAELAREHASTPARRLLALARAYVAFAVEHPAHFGVMFGPRLNEDGRFPALELAIARAYALLEDEVRRGTERGRFRERRPLDATLSLWSAVHGLASLVLVRRIRVRPDKLQAYAELLLEPLITGLGA